MINKKNNYKKYKKSNIYQKYKTRLDLIEKHINNEYFYKFIYYWGTTYKNKFYKLHSQISIYECIFLHYIVSSFNKKSIKNVNVLEIGCAYGTSGMIITNALKNYNHNQKLSYTSIDPNQETQWNNIGIYNIEKITKYSSIKKTFIFDYSTPVMKNMIEHKTRYNVIFIDGSHEYLDVLNDSKCADKLLKKKGIVVHDDILHKDVSRAIKEYYHNNNYRQIQLNPNTIKIHKIISTSKKDSWQNPYTMHAYQKIK